ncbi:unnamed protein product [Cunninghamella blakesleeana]
MERFNNFYVLTGYTTQEDIKDVLKFGEIYKTFRVFGMDKYGERIGVHKVKGVLTVVASNLNEEECILYSVKFHRREIPKDIADEMRMKTMKEGPVKKVKIIGDPTSIVINNNKE